MITKESQSQKILRRLKVEGELTNVQLNNEMHIFRYGARIMELRRDGHNIVSVHEKGGLWRFKLIENEPAPQPVHDLHVEAEVPQLALALGDIDRPKHRMFV